MSKKLFLPIGLALVSLLWAGSNPALSNEKIQVSRNGKPLTLAGTPLQVGEMLPELSLTDTSMKMVDLKSFQGKVTVLSVVPSLDTPICEKQTHILSEENEGLDQTVRLVTVSRDLPFAQKRFAKEAKIANILFLSDYRDAAFGLAGGLLIQETRLLTRAVLVLDRNGAIRHIEIVPDLGTLPDMKRALATARGLEQSKP
jgi:thiol peroxidase